jgi:hypothetical protein
MYKQNAYQSWQVLEHITSKFIINTEVKRKGRQDISSESKYLSCVRLDKSK